VGVEQRQALARLLEEDEAFRKAMSAATSVEAAVGIAGEHGVAATAEDFAVTEDLQLGDEELKDVVAGAAVYSWMYRPGTAPTTPIAPRPA
jgi:predicted ribosomally synthesized peptide with nif11-like leader